MKHIGSKLFLAFIAMTFLTVAVLWLIQAGVMRDSYLNERIRAVTQAVEQASRLTRTDYDDLSERLNASLIVVQADGRVIYSSQGLPMMGMMLRSAQNMIPRQVDGTVQYIDAATGAGRYALLGHQMNDGGYLFAVFSLADVDEASSLLRQQLWVVTLVLISTSILLAAWLSRRLAKPIRAVTNAARELACGNLAVSLPVESADEIGQMTVALNELSVELQKTEQLRRELIANVSHELRAPLSIIRGYAETVRDVTWPDEKKRTAQLSLISDEADRLTGIVRDILDYSRLQAGVEKLSRSVFPVCPVFNEVTERYAQQAGLAGLRLHVDCAPCQIIFDRNRLIQALHNLLGNALNHAAVPSTIDLLAFVDGTHCRIEIRNHGDPIPDQELARIWERYHRLNQVGQSRASGTGLGLAITRSIFEQHEIPYGVRSTGGETVFWFEVACPAESDQLDPASR